MADHILERSRAFDIKIDGNPFTLPEPIVTDRRVNNFGLMVDNAGEVGAERRS